MRLRNVRVALTKNSLLLTVAPEKDLEVSLIKIVYVAILKELAITPQCRCSPLRNNFISINNSSS